MPLTRQPASRFFAAFYRWSIHSHRTQKCSATYRHSRSKYAAISLQKRTYHTARACRQESTQPQDDVHEAFLKKEEAGQGRNLTIRKFLTRGTTRNDTGPSPQDNVHEAFLKKQEAGQERNFTIRKFLAQNPTGDDTGPSPQVKQQDLSVGNYTTDTKDEAHSSAESRLSSDLPPRQHVKYSTFSCRHLDLAGLKRNMRLLLRKVPSSVAIVTVRHHDLESQRYVPMGMPISSLTSVTLDPPTISFNIKQPSQTLDAIRKADGAFRVHILGTSAQAGKIVDLFSNGNNEEAYINRTKYMGLYVPGHRYASDITGMSKAPVILDQSVRAAMECTVIEEMVVSDHVILVAKVESLGNARPDDATLMYYDRACVSPNPMPVDSQKEQSHPYRPFDIPATAAARSLERLEDTQKAVMDVWNYSVFLGSEERQRYLNLVLEYLRARPKLQTSDLNSYLHDIENGLPISTKFFGITTRKLWNHLLKEARQFPDASKISAHDLPLDRFYGRIDPQALEILTQRAIRLVREDKQFLSQAWEVLRMNLGVSEGTINLLPSDIMVPLREAGLVGPFQEDTPTAPDSSAPGLEALERIENRLIRHLASLDFSTAALNKVDITVREISHSRSTKHAFKQSRDRLLVLAHPAMFDSTKIDIAGHVTREEARVVVCRVCRYVEAHRSDWLQLERFDLVRRLRIHPCVSGIEIAWLFAKLQHLQTSTEATGSSERFTQGIRDMFAQDFALRTNWEQLSARVREFVQKYPLRAMEWDHEENLAAMGFHWYATMTIPGSKGKEKLIDGNVLDVMVAKELKDVYGKGGMEVDERIKAFLLEKYGFDVEGTESLQVKKGTEGVKEEDNTSADEMVRDMMSSRK